MDINPVISTVTAMATVMVMVTVEVIGVILADTVSLTKTKTIDVGDL